MDKMSRKEPRLIPKRKQPRRTKATLTHFQYFRGLIDLTTGKRTLLELNLK